MKSVLMKNFAASFFVGLLFALGLGLSGMTQPQRVVAFLDFFGSWDPSLIFVMGGALAVHFVTYRWIRKRPSPLFSVDWHIPTKTELTPSLIFGSVLFGIGWALGGFCPGPALTSLATSNLSVFVFLGSMLAGMVVFKSVDKLIKFKK